MMKHYAFQGLFGLLALVTGSVSAQKCVQGEASLYVGSTGKKVALICASPAKPPFTKIEYRFGSADKNELTFSADMTNGKKFYVTNEAYEPRASLSHLWFSNGDTSYIISECTGGMCPHSGGIVVAKGSKIIARIKVKDGGFSADDAVDFAAPKSKSPLVQVKYPDGIDVTSLYSK
jgi:hypothetical protein